MSFSVAVLNASSNLSIHKLCDAIKTPKHNTIGVQDQNMHICIFSLNDL